MFDRFVQVVNVSNKFLDHIVVVLLFLVVQVDVNVIQVEYFHDDLNVLYDHLIQLIEVISNFSKYEIEFSNK